MFLSVAGLSLLSRLYYSRLQAPEIPETNSAPTVDSGCNSTNSFFLNFSSQLQLRYRYKFKDQNDEFTVNFLTKRGQLQHEIGNDQHLLAFFL